MKADPVKALELAKLACTNIAVMFGQGRGGPRDQKRAVEFYRRACKGGDDLGCENLKGRGIEP